MKDRTSTVQCKADAGSRSFDSIGTQSHQKVLDVLKSDVAGCRLLEDPRQQASMSTVHMVILDRIEPNAMQS